MNRWRLVLPAVISAAGMLALSAMPAAAERYVPEMLQPWVQWVVGDSPEASCSYRHDREEIASCIWPGRLDLRLDAEGGEFSQHWTVQTTRWVPLPGSPRHWPRSVRANGDTALVADRDGVPSLRLPTGEYEISGSFRWNTLPDTLAVPLATAILSLVLDGEQIVAPLRGDDGALALREGAGETSPGSADRLEVSIFRRLIDERPFQIHTRLSIDVSGVEREVVLPRPFVDGATPLRLEGELPIRLLADGRIQLQVRPGRLEFDLFSRLPGRVDAVRRGAVELPLPPQEVWSFDARRSLRDVRPAGLPAVDPRQTRMPPEWRDLPAFVAAPDSELRLPEQGPVAQVQPRDQLALTRDAWLDFDGSGLTFRDHIDGIVHGDDRLEVGASLTLGRALLNGEPQLITRLPDRENHGVEIRPGPIALVADLRVEGADKELPVGGWNRNLGEVATTLHLPSGWRLLAATGVERVETAWLDAWSMLDMFMVLVLSVAALRIWGPWAGAVALAALVLTWQSPGAPQYVWAPLMATCAMVNVLKAGRLRTWLLRLRLLSIIALVIVATPFLIQTAGTMLFPQLEHGGRLLPSAFAPYFGVDAAREKAAVVAESMAPQALPRTLKLAAMAPAGDAVPQEQAPLVDTALIQTGPGVPEWQWNRYRLVWGGPVGAGESYRLFLLPPLVNRALDLLRVLLSAALLAVMLLNRTGRGRGSAPVAPGAAASLLAALPLAVMAVGYETAEAAESAAFPPSALLEELRERLLEPPECVPHCLTLESVLVTADENAIRVFFELTAVEDIAVPLLTTAPPWSADRVEVDGAPAAMLGGSHEALVPLQAGHRLVEIGGPVGSVEEVLLTFPIRPHRLAVESSVWRYAGMERAGGSDRQLRLYRSLPESAGGLPSGTQAGGLIEPYFEVTRTIVLGVDALVVNEVRRLSDPRAPVSLDVPLIAGESPVSAVTFRQNSVRVTLASGQTAFRWDSVLAPGNPLILTAPTDAGWNERWRLDAGTRWHVDYSGIAPVLAGGEQGPVREWRPWPGDRLELDLVKPDAVAGDTLTIDRSRLRVSPGRQSARAELTVSLRSSRGGNHVLSLPAGADLEQFRVDGEVQPFDRGDRELAVALRPGTRTAELTWLQDGAMELVYRTPGVDLNAHSVNATVEVVPDRGRWVLWLHGPSMGPAVLYWGLLAVVLLAALGLSRLHWLPVAWWQWFLLGAGISHGSLWFAFPVIGWFLLIGYRRTLSADSSKSRFNLCQAAIVVLTPLMLVALVDAVQAGLLGDPDMQIAGNQSVAAGLSWYQDRVSSSLPQAVVVSVPMLVYRLIMLAWSLWLAFTLIGWLRWGWQVFTEGGSWRRIHWRRRKPADA